MALGGLREVPGPLLDVRDCPGQRPVHRPALPDRRLLVADRGEQRVREPHAGVAELDYPFPHSRLKRRADLFAVSVGCRDHFDCRPGERSDLKENIEQFTRQLGEPASEQLPQAIWHVERLPGRRSRVCPDELASELEREEGIARRRLLHTRELGPRQLEGQTRLQQMVKRSQAEWAEREPLEPLARKGVLELERGGNAGHLPQGRQHADAFVA